MTSSPLGKIAATLLLVLSAVPATAQKHEIGLTLGGLVSRNKTAGSNDIEFGPGTSLQFNYGYRLMGTPAFAIYAQVHMLASPQRVISSANTATTTDVASLFLTPGIRVKFLPRSPIAPWVEAGYGFLDFQHSALLANGKPNPVPRDVAHGAFEYGAGVDLPFWKFIGLRGEIRDFVTTAPEVNLPLNGKLHNVVLGGGFVLKFGNH